MNEPVVTPPWLDKALWLAVLTPVCLLLSSKIGIELTAGDVVGLLLPIVSYIVMHKWKTAKLQSAQIAADSVRSDTQAVAVFAKTGPKP